jgi:hypothetical protein
MITGTAYCIHCEEIKPVTEIHFDTRRITVTMVCGHTNEYEAELVD